MQDLESEVVVVRSKFDANKRRRLKFDDCREVVQAIQSGVRPGFLARKYGVSRQLIWLTIRRFKNNLFYDDEKGTF